MSIQEPRATQPRRNGRFRAFLRELSLEVESGSDKQALFSRCVNAMAALVAQDDWLPDSCRFFMETRKIGSAF